jgi:hypothetical protein
MQPLPKPPALRERPTGDGLDAAMYDIADALRYPVDNRGRVYDVRFLLPIIAFHLSRCGAVIDPSRAIIKARRLAPAPGVIEDAVEWVSVNAPDSIDDELAGKSLDDVDKLSPNARAELIRRLGGQAPQQVQSATETLWHVQPTIHFDDDQET